MPGLSADADIDLRVLGFNPWIEDFAAYNFWLRPLGLLSCLHAFAQCGAQTTLLDCLSPTWREMPWPRQQHGRGRFPRKTLPAPEPLQGVQRSFARYGLPLEAVETALRQLQPPPDLVLIPCLMTYWYTGAHRAIHLARNIWPRARIALGGVYPSLCPEHAKALSGADIVISGPFEQRDNWNILWRSLQMSAPPIPPAAGFSLDLRFYKAPAYGPILGSRGCVFSCAYCASSSMYPGFVQRDFSEIWHEFSLMHDRGTRDFAFFDDALLLRPRTWLVPFLERIASMGVRLHVPNAMHARALTHELASLLRAAGISRIRLGVETLDFNSRSDAKLQAQDLDQALDAMRAAGLQQEQIAAYVLVGLPDQDEEEVQATIRGLLWRGVRPIISHYSPLPGSKLFERACEVSRFDLQREPLYQNNALWPCVPGGFDWQKRSRLLDLVRGPLAPNCC